MLPALEILEIERAAVAAIRVSRKRPELWEDAARRERVLMAEIDRVKAQHAEVSQGAVSTDAGRMAASF